ncbi:ubiquitin 3 binding protein But2, partial [Lipomyces kononenkoae]
SVLPPNLLIPLKEAAPDKAFGTQFTGTVVTGPKHSDIVTFVSFDVPPLSSKQVSSCKLIWTPPSAHSFASTITGSKKVSVYKATQLIDENTLSWNHRPKRGALVGVFDAATGQFTHSTVDCEFGKKEQFELAGYGDEDTVEWFQTLNPQTGLSFV